MAKTKIPYEDIVQIAEIADHLHINGCRYSTVYGMGYKIQCFNTESGVTSTVDPEKVLKLIIDFDGVAQRKLIAAKALADRLLSQDDSDEDNT